MATQASFVEEFGSRPALERRARKLLDLIQRHGGDPSAVLAKAGIRRTYPAHIGEGLAEATTEDLRRVVASASVGASDVQARLVGREPFRNSDWRLLFYCLVGSRTLREAIGRSSELLDAVGGRLGSMWLTERNGIAHVGMAGNRGPDPELGLFVAVQGFAMYHAIFSWLVGCSIEAVGQLEFPDEYRELADEADLPFKLKFGVAEPALVFSSTHLDRPIIRSIEDCEGTATLTFLLGTVRGDDPDEVAARARRTISLVLKEESRMLPLDRVAAMLGMSRMTLRRRLHAAGTSFNRIRDGCRKELGLDLLRQTELQIEDIAHRLDFCDSDALRQSVRAWVGMSPTEYRRQAAEGQGAQSPALVRR